MEARHRGLEGVRQHRITADARDRPRQRRRQEPIVREVHPVAGRQQDVIDGLIAAVVESQANGVAVPPGLGRPRCGGPDPDLLEPGPEPAGSLPAVRTGSRARPDARGTCAGTAPAGRRDGSRGPGPTSGGAYSRPFTGWTRCRHAPSESHLTKRLPHQHVHLRPRLVEQRGGLERALPAADDRHAPSGEDREVAVVERVRGQVRRESRRTAPGRLAKVPMPAATTTRRARRTIVAGGDLEPVRVPLDAADVALVQLRDGGPLEPAAVLDEPVDRDRDRDRVSPLARSWRGNVSRRPGSPMSLPRYGERSSMPAGVCVLPEAHRRAEDPRVDSRRRSGGRLPPARRAPLRRSRRRRSRVTRRPAHHERACASQRSTQHVNVLRRPAGPTTGPPRSAASPPPPSPRAAPDRRGGSSIALAKDQRVVRLRVHARGADGAPRLVQVERDHGQAERHVLECLHGDRGVRTGVLRVGLQADVGRREVLLHHRADPPIR